MVPVGYLRAFTIDGRRIELRLPSKPEFSKVIGDRLNPVRLCVEHCRSAKSLCVRGASSKSGYVLFLFFVFGVLCGYAAAETVGLLSGWVNAVGLIVGIVTVLLVMRRRERSVSRRVERYPARAVQLRKEIRQRTESSWKAAMTLGWPPSTPTRTSPSS